jgi:hypothetical protein
MSSRYSLQKAKDLAVMEELQRELGPKNVLVIRLNRIMDAALQFHERLWFGNRRLMRKYLRDHPDEFRAKFASSTFFFNKALPTKILHQGSSGQPAKRVTADDFERMGLSMEDAKKLAGLSEVNSVESKNKEEV